jgi:hypothetical protein
MQDMEDESKKDKKKKRNWNKELEKDEIKRNGGGRQVEK